MNSALLISLLVAGFLTASCHGKALADTSEEQPPTVIPAAESAEDDSNAPTPDQPAAEVAATSTPPSPAPPAPASAPALAPTAVDPTTAASVPSAAAESPPVIENLAQCIRCICLSMSKCDETVCDPQTGLCDLWHITYTTWRSSGSPMVPDREFPNPVSAFEHCRSNETCAAQTITQYFELNKQDCNADGVIDCLDMTIVHTSSPKMCSEWPRHVSVHGIPECLAEATEAETQASAISGELDAEPEPEMSIEEAKPEVKTTVKPSKKQEPRKHVYVPDINSNRPELVG